MKIEAPLPPLTGAAARVRTGAAPGFALATGEAVAAQAPARTGAPVPLMAAGAVGALLAAQGEAETPAERRRRAAARGRVLLDRMDAIRIGLLEGAVAPADVARLAAAIRAERAAVDDPVLSALLDDIDLRAEVELAKLQRTA